MTQNLGLEFPGWGNVAGNGSKPKETALRHASGAIGGGGTTGPADDAPSDNPPDATGGTGGGASR